MLNEDSNSDMSEEDDDCLEYVEQVMSNIFMLNSELSSLSSEKLKALLEKLSKDTSDI